MLLLRSATADAEKSMIFSCSFLRRSLCSIFCCFHSLESKAKPDINLADHIDLPDRPSQQTTIASAPSRNELNQLEGEYNSPIILTLVPKKIVNKYFNAVITRRASDLKNCRKFVSKLNFNFHIM